MYIKWPVSFLKMKKIISSKYRLILTKQKETTANFYTVSSSMAAEAFML